MQANPWKIHLGVIAATMIFTVAMADRRSERVVAQQPIAAATIAPESKSVMTARDLDAWARFPVGSWRVVRTTTQTYDPFGKITQSTVSESQTTLSRVDNRQMCLKIDVTTQVNGRRIQGTPHEVEQGFWGETAEQPVEEKTAVPTKISIEGREVPCILHEASYGDEQLKTVTKKYVSTDLAPFVLKRESQTMAPNSKQPRYRTVSEVFALDMPCKVGSEIKLGSHERLVRKTPQETMISLDTTVPEIPGGVVARTTKELDGEGRLLRHSTMELISYHIASEKDPQQEQRRRRLFHRDTARHDK